MHLTLDAVTKHRGDISTFWFRPEQRLDYLAGQFINLTLPHIGGRERNRRWFTLSSSPTEEYLSITTRISPQSTSLYKRTLAQLPVGATVIASEPMGDFVLPMQQDTPILFVAGGMGITPVRSMVKWLIDRAQQRPIKVIYAVHQPRDIVFDTVLSEYNLEPHYIASEPDSAWKHGVGRLNAEQILAHYPNKGYIYISGPELMTERLVDELKQKKFPSNKIVTDYFPGYAAL